MFTSADIRVVHASRSRHPLAIRPANNGAGSRGLDAKAQLKLPSKNRQARNWQRRQHCKARNQGANKPHACFFATRDIEAGETLTYLRDQAAVAAVSGRAGAVGQGGVGYKPIKCLCGHPGCRGFA